MLAIKLNNNETPSICALCHQLVHPHAGPELFLADNWEPVCHACGREHEPELVALLNLGKAAGAYAGELFQVLGEPEAA